MANAWTASASDRHWSLPSYSTMTEKKGCYQMGKKGKRRVHEIRRLWHVEFFCATVIGKALLGILLRISHRNISKHDTNIQLAGSVTGPPVIMISKSVNDFIYTQSPRICYLIFRALNMNGWDIFRNKSKGKKCIYIICMYELKIRKLNNRRALNISYIKTATYIWSLCIMLCVKRI